MSIDGQPVKAEGTGSVNLIFPAQGSETGVLVEYRRIFGPDHLAAANTAKQF
jgi:hypothetical protein